MIGPLLFVFNINDLLTSLLVTSVMPYADDVTLVFYGQQEAKAAGALQAQLNGINYWCICNTLQVNTDKKR